MRISGLASGMDIDELVKKLMTAEKAPLNKLYQKKQIYEWQRDAYRSVNTKLKTFDTYIADNLILKNIGSKTATSSNSSLVSAIATSQASGTVSIDSVSQLATAARGVSSTQVLHSSSTKLSELFGEGETLPNTISIQSIDKQGKLIDPVPIAINGNMTIDDLMSKINSSNAGVSALFENGKLSITAKNTGQAADGQSIKIDENGLGVFAKLGLIEGDIKEGQNARFVVNGIATERSSNSFSINGYNITLNSTFNEKDGHNKLLEAAKETLILAQKKITETFENLKVKYEIDTNGKSLDDVFKEFTDKFAPLSTTYSEDVAATREALIAAQEEKISGTTAGEIFNSLSNEAKAFLRNVSIDSTTKLTEENFDDTLSDKDKSQLLALNLTGSDISKVNTVQDTIDNVATANAALQAARNKDLNGISAGERFDNLSDDAKAFLKGISGETALTDDDFKDIGLSDDEKIILKSYTSDLKAVQTATEENETATAELNTATTADINKVTAGGAYNSLSSTARDFLKQANLDDPSFNLADELDKLSPEDKVQLETYNVDQLKQIKEVGTKVEEFGDATTKLQNLNNDMSKVTNEYSAYTTAFKNKESIEKSAPSNENIVQAVTLTSTTNVDEMMTKIKDFVNTYNGLIKDFTAQTKETKYRDYTPLTDEQKEEMSENEIKLWEEKAKSGLLRNDSLIREGLSNMRSLIYQSHPAIDSKYNSLFSIGITTSKNYNDGGTLEIDEDKLRKVLEEDPTAVEKLFKNSDGKEKDLVEVQENGQTVTKEVDTRGFLYNLRSSMNKMVINIEKKAGRSTMTDVQYTIGKNLIDTEDRIDTWKKKLETIEARYWKQFSAMESAINKANSQASLFTQGQ